MQVLRLRLTLSGPNFAQDDKLIYEANFRGRTLELPKSCERCLVTEQDIHAETYLAGPRYHFNMGRFQPYVKGLGGLGKFSFTYNYAHGTYYVIGGRRRTRLRALPALERAR